MGIHHVKSLDLARQVALRRKRISSRTCWGIGRSYHADRSGKGYPHGRNGDSSTTGQSVPRQGHGRLRRHQRLWQEHRPLQVQELGTIETPIILTNTMSIGTAYTALCKYMLEQNPDIGVTTGTVNCLVTECNDSSLNDIRGMHVQESDVRNAIETAAQDFAEGCVGGGNGMRCLGLKGGIGSASRVLEIDGAKYTVGALVMSNFERPATL